MQRIELNKKLVELVQHKFQLQELIDLIKAGADVNLRLSAGNTLLHLAAIRRPSLIQSLLVLGADPNLKNHDNLTPMAILSSKPYDASHFMFELLHYGADVNERLYRGNTLLHIAACRWHNLIHKLLVKGADPTILNDNKETPLHVLICTHFVDQHLFLMIEHGANVNEQFMHGDTLLHLAAKIRPQLIPKLLKLGADKSIKNDFGQVPLLAPMTAENMALVAETNASSVSWVSFFSGASTMHRAKSLIINTTDKIVDGKEEIYIPNHML